MALEPDINDPDWGRYRVANAGGVAPVGDPTRWGAQAFTRITPGKEAASQQILAIGTSDNYARSWSLMGNLVLPYWLWDTQSVVVRLEVTCGVGQVQIVQPIVLYKSDGAANKQGLVADQFWEKGGPYWETYEPTRSEVPADAGGVDKCRSFAAVGAIVGQSIGIRALYTMNIAAPGACVSRLALIITPHAAGEGL